MKHVSLVPVLYITAGFWTRKRTRSENHELFHLRLPRLCIFCVCCPASPVFAHTLLSPISVTSLRQPSHSFVVLLPSFCCRGEIIRPKAVLTCCRVWRDTKAPALPCLIYCTGARRPPAKWMWSKQLIPLIKREALRLELHSPLIDHRLSLWKARRLGRGEGKTISPNRGGCPIMSFHQSCLFFCVWVDIACLR